MHNIWMLLVALVGLQACASQGSRDQQAQAIQALEDKLRQQQDVTLDTVSAFDLIARSLRFAEAFPQDTLAPVYLFRAADVARGTGRYQQAIDLWGQVHSSFPAYERAPAALFLQGFTADKDLEDAALATTYYEAFISQYPAHPRVGDAQMLLQLLQSNKTPEELIREFQARQAAGGGEE